MPPKNKRKPAPKRHVNHAHPPVIPGNTRGRHIFRFKQTDLATTNITLYIDDFAFFQCVATSTTTVRTIWETFKVEKIEIWSPARIIDGTLQDPKRTGLTWKGLYVGRSEVFGTTNQQTGVTHLVSKPPRDAACSKWQKISAGASSDTELVSLDVPDQSVIDITLRYIYDDDSVSQITKAGYTGLYTGYLYYSAADSYWGSKRLQPMGLTAP